MVRRVTRSSPDSDDTYPGDDVEDPSMRDDQFLVSDRSESKFYGSLPGATGGTSAGTNPTISNIARRLQVSSTDLTSKNMLFNEDICKLQRKYPMSQNPVNAFRKSTSYKKGEWPLAKVGPTRKLSLSLTCYKLLKSSKRIIYIILTILPL